VKSGCGEFGTTSLVLTKGMFIKGREAVNSPPLATFQPSSVDELADQFENGNQRIC